MFMEKVKLMYLSIIYLLDIMDKIAKTLTDLNKN